MRPLFSLFQSHIDFAHELWKKVISPGDTVIDATAGNGYDALILADLALGEDRGKLHLFDIQKIALQESLKRLKENLPEASFKKISAHHLCHSKMAEIIEPASVKLIVFNLGYLPGADKSITTLAESTIESLKAAQTLIGSGGVISLTCYPGHEEGRRERDEIVLFCQTLDPKTWSVSSHSWLNRRLHPQLILLSKSGVFRL